MKTILAAILYSASALAGYNLKIDFKDNSEASPLSMKDNIEINLGDVKTITIPDSIYEFEVTVKEKSPKNFKHKSKNMALVEYRLFTKVNDVKTLSSSGKITTCWGHEARIIHSKDETKNDLITELKIIPLKNEL